MKSCSQFGGDPQVIFSVEKGIMKVADSNFMNINCNISCFGMYGATLNVANSTFSSISASKGVFNLESAQGIGDRDSPVVNSQLFVTSSIFKENSGVLTSDANVRASFMNCTFKNNHHPIGGIVTVTS